MKLKALWARPIELGVGVGIGTLCALMVLYGLALFGFQCVLWAYQGAWVELPASYLFIEPGLPRTDQEIYEYLQQRGVSEESISQQDKEYFRALEEIGAAHGLVSFTPDWFRSDESWLAQPEAWYGPHKIIMGTLRFLSIPVLAVMLGLMVAIVGAVQAVKVAEATGEENGKK
ncbi:MAG: hypothetical protein V3T23_09770 [Nitrososphaerales archaeon]